MPSTIGFLRGALARRRRPPARRYLTATKHCAYCNGIRWFEYRPRPANGTRPDGSKRLETSGWYCRSCHRPV